MKKGFNDFDDTFSVLKKIRDGEIKLKKGKKAK